MMLSGCSTPSAHVLTSSRAFKSASYKAASGRSQNYFARCSWGSSLPHNELQPKVPRGVPLSYLSASSSQLLNGEQGSLSCTLPILPVRRRKTLLTPRASNDDIPRSSGFKYPPMTKRPAWWWRTLACIPYLMPLHETWMFAETAYSLHPFLEQLEFLCYPFLTVLGTLPTWFLIAYFFIAYLGVVRRKEWPHFFRYHVVLGMLLEISIQVLGLISKWMPAGLYWGKLGMHFWAAVSFAFLFTILTTIQCALCGVYADIPIYSDAAYIQIPYEA